jgi:hypothetical protein
MGAEGNKEEAYVEVVEARPLGIVAVALAPAAPVMGRMVEWSARVESTDAMRSLVWVTVAEEPPAARTLSGLAAARVRAKARVEERMIESRKCKSE